MIRIERLLSNRGYCLRSDARGFLRAHEVCAAGKRIGKESDRVDENKVTIDGEPIDPGVLVLVMNKPVGLTCSHKDLGPIVYDLLPERYRQRDPAIATVGRLDKETSGVLILTDDGALLHRLTSPKWHVPRVYVAELDRPLRGDEDSLFGTGTMMLENEDKPLLPAGFEALGEKRARVTLTEGRYHQLRRMFAAVGNHVVKLEREKFGEITVKGEGGSGLEPGQWRLATAAEVATLKA